MKGRVLESQWLLVDSYSTTESPTALSPNDPIRNIDILQKSKSEELEPCYSPLRRLESKLKDNIATALRIPRLNIFNFVAKWEAFDNQSEDNPLITRQAKVLVCTWNLHGTLPSEDEVKLLLKPSIKHDIYVIGTQECQRSIAFSVILKSKADWETIIQYSCSVNFSRKVLGSDYVMICSDTLMATHIAIYVSTQILPIVKSKVTITYK